MQLYRDADPIGPTIVLADNAASFVRLDSLTPYVFPRARELPTGAFALSNQSTAPGVAVVIDAFPWANVTITSVDGRIQPLREQTPATLRLPEGQYELRLENPSVTEASQDDHRVARGNANEQRFPMPGVTVERGPESAQRRKPGATEILVRIRRYSPAGTW